MPYRRFVNGPDQDRGIENKPISISIQRPFQKSQSPADRPRTTDRILSTTDAAILAAPAYGDVYLPGYNSIERSGESMKTIIAMLIAMSGVIGDASAQDAASGEKVFLQCRACHAVGENAKNAVGPVLNGLFGRKSGTVPGYAYTQANKDSGIVWDESVFVEYIRDPKAKIPGTKMVYPGLKDEKRVKDLIAYLKQFNGEGKKAQ
jgi:cytochrome c